MTNFGSTRNCKFMESHETLTNTKQFFELDFKTDKTIIPKAKTLKTYTNLCQFI